MALTDFWMLHGFRPLEQIAEALRKVPELCSIMPDFSVRLARAGEATQARRDLLCDLYRAAMTMPQERVDLLLNALVERLLPERGPTRTVRITGSRGPQRHFRRLGSIATAASSRFIC